MGVLFQAFYWNCPQQEQQEGTWWNFVASKIPELQQAGFTALWLPPACKAANLGGPSMGYDPYDYYDLGDFNQKGRTKTWFGNQAELVALINAAHTANMQVVCRPGARSQQRRRRAGGQSASTARRAGPYSIPPAASSRAPGSASIRRLTKPSTR